MSSSESSMVSGLPFRSLLIFHVFLYMVWGNVLISLFYMELSSFPSTTSWKICLFSIVYSYLLCHELTIEVWLYFLVCTWFHWSVSVFMIQMWELDYKEDWVLKNCCFQTLVLEKILDRSLDIQEMKPVDPKGNQTWYTSEGLMLNWNSSALATSWEESEDNRGWDGWMASPTQWTWVWESSRRSKKQGSWSASVHGVKKSQTKLSNFKTITNIHLYICTTASDPLICWLKSRLTPCSSYCKYGCNKHWGSVQMLSRA